MLEEIRNGPEKQEEEEGIKEGAAEGCEGGGVSRLSFVRKNNFLRFTLKVFSLRHLNRFFKK